VIKGIASKTKISVMVDVDKAIYLANHFSGKGYETAVNIMAISRALDSELTECLQQLEKECKAQIINIVDSFGSLYQETTEFLFWPGKGGGELPHGADTGIPEEPEI